MAWLVSEGRVLASADVAAAPAERRRGLLRRDGIDGALVIDPCRWVHTVGMRFPVDVAFLDADGVVLKTVQISRHRLGSPGPRAWRVGEAGPGAFARWGVHVGMTLEIRS